MYKVVVVEDEEMIRRGLIYMVDWTKFGCVVAAEAANGVKGLEAIEAVRPDLVITDLKMPLMGGLEMLAASIGTYGYEALILSGYGEFEYAKQAIDLSVSAYLLKPLEFEAIERAMEKISVRLCQKHKLRRLENAWSTEANGLLNLESIESQLSGTSSSAREMIDFIKQNYGLKISMNDLSDIMAMSATSLNKKFKEATSYTFNEFLNRYRIRQAVRLLVTTDKRVYEVAEETGFADYKYFTLVFKKYMGCAPLEFSGKAVSERK